MKKKIDWSIILTTGVCLLPILLSLTLYKKLPNEIPIHFNALGKADNYLSKEIVCFVMPFAFAILHLMGSFMRNADPKKANSSQAIKTMSKWIIPVLSILCISSSLFISLGENIPIHIIVPTLSGILILICGNYLPKCRQNYTIGIKLPWTLHNEDNWNKTHRMAGVLWIIGGLVIITASLFQYTTLPVIGIVLILLTIVPILYSYFLYRQEI